MDSKRTTIALNGSVLLLMFGVGLITPILPFKIFSLSQSTVQVGILAAAFACSYVLVQIPLGMLADRFGCKLFIVLGYVLCGTAGIFYFLAGSSNTLLVGRVIQGLGEAPLWALAPAIFSIINEKRKGKAIGRYNACIHLGLTGGSLIGFISLEFFTELQIFTAYVFMCAISAIWTSFGVQEDTLAFKNRRKCSLLDEQDGTGFLKEPSVIAVLLGIALYGIGYGVFMTIIPTYMSSIMVSNYNLSGLMFIAFYIGITLAQFIGGPIVDSKGRIIPMLGGLFFYSTGMLIFFHTSSTASLLILTIASFGLGLFLVGSIAFLNDQVGKSSKGFVSGLFYFFWGIGYFLGPIILGYAGKFNYYPQGFSAIGISGLVVSCLILITYRSSPQKRRLHMNS